MGIQGLLPMLKPIQRQRHLSGLSGQTLAVDAYVWLHRGTFGCAAEVATGKPTTKYVDFCMRHVRLLRHYNITPFLVFDGGPLPAKQGTEKEREAKRRENLEKANLLSSRGRHTQAREFYVKCVDITPQMAYQVIKMLKAENVPYVVAPYEADAQLAYLERAGYVDGIITEDSDLLVFGCKNVHFKLDAKEATVVSISRSDLGSPALIVDSMSFVGWSDDQFRWMAMLSGCDYLPSINGVGLKTAWTLLKKHKTFDKVIRALRMEGKKDVPSGYLRSFQFAEKVFLHQRVYDPGLEKLVYLTEPAESSLCEEGELYIGRDLDQSLAKDVAEGNVCPISLRPMDDINPRFTPGQHKSSPFTKKAQNSPLRDKRESGGMTPTRAGGLLNFFTPVAKSPLASSSKNQIRTTIVSGNASGKRKLRDLVVVDDSDRKETRPSVSSRFFSCPSPGISRQRENDCVVDGKENQPILIVDSDEEFDSKVNQEDGYISPSPCISRAVTPDLSSPRRPGDEDHPDNLSSPIVERRSRDVSPEHANAHTQDISRVLVEGTPELEASGLPGPDLAPFFDDIECFEDPNCPGDTVPATQCHSPCEELLYTQDDIDELWDAEKAQKTEALARVVKGWREKYTFDRGRSTPVKHNISRSVSTKTLPSSTGKTRLSRLKMRRSEPYPTTSVRMDSSANSKPVSMDDGTSVTFSETSNRLNKFRFRA